MTKVCPLIALVLLLTTFGLYWQTKSFDFIAYDDQTYVYGNVTTNGLNTATIKWAFTDSYKTLDNWHPLTVLSLLTDVELFGVNPGAMHLHNAVIHAINAVLLFFFLLLLGRATFSERAASLGRAWVSDPAAARSENVALPICLPICLAAFMGAAFWAWHPLRVESVAWISSRKDVLCVFWYLLGHLVYLKWNKGERGFLFAIPAFLFAFASKPTAIVFPGTLFLIDYVVYGKIQWRRITVFASATMFFAALVIISQEYAITDCYPLLTRLLNAVASIGDYCLATLWPTKLCPFYPYEDPVSLVRFVPGAIVLLLFAVVLAPFLRLFLTDIKRAYVCEDSHSFTSDIRTRPSNMVIFGLLWFCLSLLPVVGIIHVGFASHADRYTYLSGIGLSMVLSWFVLIIVQQRNRLLRLFLLTTFGAAVILYAFLASAQIRLWQNTLPLFTHTLKYTQENFIAHSVVSSIYCRQKRLGKAFEHARLYMATYSREDLSPSERMEACLFLLFKDEGHPVETYEDLFSVQVKDAEPWAAEKLYALAVLAYGRKLSSAELFIKESLRLKPTDGYSWEFYARILLSQERKEEALKALKKAHELLPARRMTLKLMNQGL
ncbi:MAG: tetratricopeptide repeat protein [bacterium]